jgi:hypothetical protein
MTKSACAFVLLVFFSAWARAAEPKDFTIETFVNLGSEKKLISVVQYIEEIGELTFTGEINRGAVDGILRNPNFSNLRVLRISSGGGDVYAAIDLARVVYLKKTKLIIDGLCASSCANYILPAGGDLEVTPGSAIAVHGSASTTSKYETNDERKAFFAGVASVYEIPHLDLLGIRLDLFDLWDSIVSRLLIATSGIQKSEMGCLGVYKLWAPTPKDWSSIGVKNTDKIWYPTSKSDLSLTKDRNPEMFPFIYFGSAQNLKNLCLD